MCFRGKRDGLSKEGSGRVAVYKSTGLIKSYTLESNYNTGKCVNVLPARAKEQNLIPTKMTTVPPKYTPDVFEEVIPIIIFNFNKKPRNNKFNKIISGWQSFRTFHT